MCVLFAEKCSLSKAVESSTNLSVEETLTRCSANNADCSC